MAVVAAVELEDAVASREPAGEPDGAHRRLGAGGDEPHQLHGRDRVHDLLGELDLALRRRAVASCRRPRRLDGLDRLRVGVAEDERPPGHDPVEVARPRRPRGRPPSAPDEERLPSPTARIARTGELTPPGINRCARPKASSPSLEPPGELLGPVGTIRSAPARLIAVRLSSTPRRSSSQPFAGGRLDHRVLAADVVGGDRHVEGVLARRDHVEVGQGRLDHDACRRPPRGRARSRAAPRGRWPGPSGSCGGRRTAAPTRRPRGTGRRTPRRTWRSTP